MVLEVREDAARVVKRFHHPNPLLARFDRGRAQREFAALVELAGAGFPVPRPLDLRATERGWELALAPVPGARTLQELLASSALRPGAWEALLARLGVLLARLQAAGWAHGDLHAGNVIVDREDRPWLIDLQRAERVVASPARSLSEVVECAAMAREHLPARVRARFLVAWRAALPAELRPRLAGQELARAVEERARVRRRERVEIGLLRWLRESSRVIRSEHAGAGLWLRRDLGPVLGEERLPARWLVLRGEHEMLRALWLGAARLSEHGLPVARPAAFAPGRGRTNAAWVAFEPALGCAPSRAELLDRLADRGLVLASPRLEQGERGFSFLPPREPQDFLEA